MNARQLCNYVYAVRVESCESQSEIDEFDDWLNTTLDPAKAAAEKAFIRGLRGGF